METLSPTWSLPRQLRVAPAGFTPQPLPPTGQGVVWRVALGDVLTVPSGPRASPLRPPHHFLSDAESPPDETPGLRLPAVRGQARRAAVRAPRSAPGPPGPGRWRSVVSVPQADNAHGGGKRAQRSAPVRVRSGVHPTSETAPCKRTRSAATALATPVECGGAADPPPTPSSDPGTLTSHPADCPS